jgi:hypothetical protein
LRIDPRFHITDDEDLMFDDSMCVPKDLILKNKILTEARDSGYAIHPDEAKKYQTLLVEDDAQKDSPLCG